MSTRFLYNLILSLAAGFLVVATMAFAPFTVAWITFGIAAGITALSLGYLPLHAGIVQRGLTGAVLALGIWTIVASLVFASTTVVWLGFASALGFVGLGVAGLTAHELRAERVVHSLHVGLTPAEERMSDRVAA
jgi:hypothetical protein